MTGQTNVVCWQKEIGVCQTFGQTFFHLPSAATSVYRDPAIYSVWWNAGWISKLIQLTTGKATADKMTAKPLAKIILKSWCFNAKYTGNY